ncbi:hypothetical protein GWK48_00140 [Metallosphaera tengchongensis]|uniref:Uncharacterized protein n=1 Tax=Metallosphaera tengchongensis TaxID=1532350 RepID=A0A6N0NS21_9CREN|nr:hypothetical protein [Metallosphaera tengchongensis]QKQ98984.1 hypothetical protein GWK48_00140 [Metallosphaera tengchongensis]
MTFSIGTDDDVVFTYLLPALEGSPKSAHGFMVYAVKILLYFGVPYKVVVAEVFYVST